MSVGTQLMPHIVSLPLGVSPKPQPGPHLSPGVITKCTQGLARGAEQGEGPCPLASRLAEVGPVCLHLVPLYCGPHPLAASDQTAWDSPGAASGVTRMLGHICMQTPCISMHFHVICRTSRADIASRGKVIASTQGCAPLHSFAFLPKLFAREVA